MIRALVLSTAFLVACGQCLVDNVDDTDDTFDTDDTDDTDDTGPLGQRTAVITTTDFAVGSLATIDLDTGVLSDELAPTSGDPFVFTDDRYVFQLNGFGNDSVRVYEHDQFVVPVTEFTVGAGANPHDVARVGNELFVSLYEIDYLGVYEVTTGAARGAVPLHDYSDADGVPEASSLHLLDGTLYAALQQFDADWVVAGGVVVAIGPSTKAVDKSWNVGSSPILFAHPYDPGTLAVMTGSYDPATYAPNLDGGLAVLDPDQAEVGALVLDESVLGYHLTAYTESDNGHAIFLTDNGDYTYSVRCYDWSSGTVSELANTGDWLASATANDRGQAWVVSRSWSGDSGIRVYDIDACEAVGDGALIQTSLPPYSVAFY